MCQLVDEAYGQAIREYEALEVKITDATSMCNELDDLMCDDSREFSLGLVTHFLIADGMPSFSDVREYMESWHDRDFDDDVVDQVCQIMEFIYPVSWE